MEIILKDPTTFKNVKWLDHIFLPMLNDKRDMAFIYLSLKITFTIIPLALLFF